MGWGQLCFISMYSHSVTDVRDGWYNSVHLTYISPASVYRFTHLL